MNLLVVDVDGTLLDNLQAEDACFAQALSGVMGVHSLDSDWDSYEHVSDQGVAVEAFERCFGAAPSRVMVDRAIEQFVKLLESALRSQPIVAVAGAARLLRELPRHGWFPVIATGAWRRAAELKLRAAGLSFGALPMATAEDGQARADIMRVAMERAAATQAGHFTRVVAIGDAVWDVEAARSMALPFVGRAIGPRAALLRAAGASHVLPDFSDLTATVAALDAARVPTGITKARSS